MPVAIAKPDNRAMDASHERLGKRHTGHIKFDQISARGSRITGLQLSDAR